MFVPLLEGMARKPQTVLADAGYDALDAYRYVVEELGGIAVIKANLRGKKKEGRTPHRTLEMRRLLALRENPGIDRGAAEWQRFYNMRTAVERVFSRMKEQRCLNRLRQRGLAKVTTHVYLSALSMVATGLAFGVNGERLQFAA